MVRAAAPSDVIFEAASEAVKGNVRDDLADALF